MNRVRLADIAESLRIDLSTVSRGLRGDPRVHEGTQKLIRMKAKKMGYVSNVAARTLVLGRTNIVWFLVPGLKGLVEQEPAFYAGLALFEKGYDLHIIPYHDRLEFFSRLVRQLCEGSADGAIVIPGKNLTKGIFSDLIDRKFPFIFLDRHVLGLSASAVTSANEKTTGQMVEKMLQEGAESFLVGFDRTNTVEEARYQGAVKILKKNAIPFKQIRDEEPVRFAEKSKVGILFSSQGSLVHWLEKSDSPPGIFHVAGVFDSWLGKTGPFELVLVAEQDFKEMSEKAVSLLMDQMGGSSSGATVTEVRMRKLRRISR